MDIEKAVRSLAMPLPEDILKRKWAGDFAGAMAAIDLRLQEQLPEMLAWRLRVERERLRRMPTQYPWNRAQAFEKLRALVPDITEAEFDSLEMQGKVDFLYINGEKLEENYGMEVIKPETIGRAAEPIELGDDEYFVMGDNRNNSSDSRTDMVGNIKRENIIGKAWLRIWPVSDFGILQHQ